jgi:ABC-2 type transport system ATP-binding protein
MDEAEYCGRVGIMRDGKLLAMNTPSALKQHALPGIAWDVFAQPLLAALTALEHCSAVLRAGLTADHLRAITPSNTDAEALRACLVDAGIQVVSLERVEPTLEDVFLALADTNIT